MHRTTSYSFLVLFLNLQTIKHLRTDQLYCRQRSSGELIAQGSHVEYAAGGAPYPDTIEAYHEGRTTKQKSKLWIHDTKLVTDAVSRLSHCHDWSAETRPVYAYANLDLLQKAQASLYPRRCIIWHICTVAKELTCMLNPNVLQPTFCVQLAYTRLAVICTSMLCVRDSSP